MKKFATIAILLLLFSLPVFSWGRKQKPVLVLSDNVKELSEFTPKNVFKTNTRIFFTISNPSGFKSDYIKYQIVKQDDKAHVGGYTRIRNITCRLKDKHSYSDYFLISEKGKYFIQVFDITNLQQWLAIEGFQVIEN